MAERGDVCRVKRRLGFGAPGETEAVVVIQATPLNRVLDTLIVIPLAPWMDKFAGLATVLRVPAREAGSAVEQAAIATELGRVRADRLAAGVVAKLAPGTLARLDRILRLVLDL
jgi:hypothetical protein